MTNSKIAWRSYFLGLLGPFVTLVGFGVSAIAAPIPATQPASHPTTQSDNKTIEQRLVLHPSIIPSPPLRYRLLPNPAEIEPGNAATLYLLGITNRFLYFNTYNNPEKQGTPCTEAEFSDLIDKYLENPLTAADRENAAKVLVPYARALHFFEQAAFRQNCNFESTERKDGFMALLPHLSDMRHVGILLALQAKLQILNGKYDDAARTLSTGFALARHMGRENGFLVQTMVANGIAKLMCEQVQHWIQTDGSPNLYWSLSQLPDPFFDFSLSVEAEYRGHHFHFPQIKDAAAGKMSLEQLTDITKAFLDMQIMMGRVKDDATGPFTGVIAHAATNMAWMLAAKTDLLQIGYKQSEIDAMTTSHLIGLWLGQSHEYIWQEQLKHTRLKYHEVMTLIGKPAKDRPNAERMFPQSPWHQLVPSLSKARFTFAKLDHHIEQMRSLEILRAFAADNEGVLPEHLGKYPKLPVPTDVFTGKPMDYILTGKTATITTPSPRAMPNTPDEILHLEVRP